MTLRLDIARAGIALLLASSCGKDVELGHDYALVAADSGGGDRLLPDAQVPCTITPCGGKIYACGDCIDNDADGLVDSADTQDAQNPRLSALLARSLNALRAGVAVECQDKPRVSPKSIV